ncbi:MAG: outer membrane beta-barrel domain-containing protein [Pseudomonadota bacterium]
MTKKWFAVIAVGVTLTFLPQAGFSQDAAKKDDRKQENAIGDYRVEGIDVVQQRVFLKGGRHELKIDGGVIPNNTFIMYEMMGVRYAYHLNEGVAFEASYQHAFHQEKAIINDLRNIPCPADPFYTKNDDGTYTEVTNCGVELQNPPDPIKNVYFGTLIWSPIYGKLAIFSKKIFHFDLNLNAGVGMYQNHNSNRLAFAVGIGGKIFMNDWMAVNVDIRNYTVQEKAPFSEIVNNQQYSLGVSFFFPFHPIRE